MPPTTARAPSAPLDGGKTWQQTISEHVAGDRWTTTGYDVTTCYGVHFDPFRRETMFISYTDIGLFKSDDAGHTWKSSIGGIPRKWQNTTYWVAFDPQVKGLMWGGFALTHDLPRAKMWQRRDVEDFAGGVGTSTDGGEHWTVTNSGMPETPVTHILLDPASPVGARTLYACGFGRGVYKSVDNGKTWALKIDGIEKHQPFAWRITRADNGTLYLVVSRRSERAGAPETEDGALYKSTDGAEHWVKMKLPAGTNGPTGLTLDPKDNRRMYLSAWGAQAPGSRYRRRRLPLHRRRRHMEQYLRPVAARLRRDRRPAGSEHPLQLRLRSGRVALHRSRQNVDAHPRFQLQVGPPRDSGPGRSLAHLHHDIRRQRLARSGGRRSEGNRRHSELTSRTSGCPETS